MYEINNIIIVIIKDYISCDNMAVFDIDCMSNENHYTKSYIIVVEGRQLERLYIMTLSFGLMPYAAEGLGIKPHLLRMDNVTMTTVCRVCTLNCEGFIRNSLYVNYFLNSYIYLIFYVFRKLGFYMNRQIEYAAFVMTI